MSLRDAQLSERIQPTISNADRTNKTWDQRQVLGATIFQVSQTGSFRVHQQRKAMMIRRALRWRQNCD